MPAQPQDHKTKPDTAFAFKGADGKTYRLPRVTEKAAQALPGGVMFDAVMDPDNDMAQMRLGLSMLTAAGPTPAALAALKALPVDQMLQVVGDWMGESQGSSD